MESFIFAVKAVAPIVLMVLLGYIFKRMGLMDERFCRMANKLVFRVFMPVMLFVKLYGIKSLSDVNIAFILYGAISVLVIFAVSVPATIMLTKHKDRRGVLVQAIFRSGYSLIGIPLAQSLFGEEGAIAATLLSAVVIPIFNVLAVLSLSLLGDSHGEKPSIKKSIVGIVTNPLILGIAAALLVVGIRSVFANVGISFRLSSITPLFDILGFLSSLAVPLALLVLGAQFEFSAVASLKKEIIFGVVARTVVVPAVTLGIAYGAFRAGIWGFGPAHFATFVAAFATPVAVPSVPMVQEMGGDVTLAGQLVVWSTLVSALTLFIITFLLKAGGAL